MFAKIHKSTGRRIILMMILVIAGNAVIPGSVKAETTNLRPGNEDGIILSPQTISSSSQLSSITRSYQWHTFYDNMNEPYISVDQDGNIYMVGYSNVAWDGPGSTSPLNSYQGTTEIVLVKLNSSGIYQWHTFYGSSEYDFAYRLTVDSDGNIYIAGESNATWNGPGNVAPLNAFAGDEDMVLIKLDSSGMYQWHTFFGSTITSEGGSDSARDVALDGDGNIYVVGASQDTWHGPGSLPPLHSFTGDNDITVIKLNNSGTYQWHTFYGSTEPEGAHAVDTDDVGNVYVVGSTVSWSGPGSSVPLHPYAGGNFGDFVVLKLDSSGSYQWHTFYGSYNMPDSARDIVIDSNDNIYVAGYGGATWYGPNSTLPLHAYSGGTVDMAILKLNSLGGYQWHTFYGSSAADGADGIAVNVSGDVIIAGHSDATWNGPNSTPPLYPFTNGRWNESDIVVSKLDSNGTYQWHTFYGGTSTDTGRSISAIPNGMYIAGISIDTWNGPGNTSSLNPAGPYGSFNGFVIKMTEPIPTVLSSLRVNTDPTSAASVNFAVTFSRPVTGVDMDDFALTVTDGISEAMIDVITPNAACTGNTYCSTYIVTVERGIGVGTLRLDVPDTATITDAAGNSLVDLPFEEGEFYTIEKVPGAGKYDDRDPNWVYTSSIKKLDTSGPYKKTLTYLKAVGNTAEFEFTGSVFTLWYMKYTDQGKLAVYIDDNPTPYKTLNQKGSSRAWQVAWTSGNLGSGTHKVKLVHAGSGTYVNIDAIQVSDVLGDGTYEDTNRNLVYIRPFSKVSASGASGGSYMRTKTVGDTATFWISGSQLSLWYMRYKDQGKLEVYIDGVLVKTLNQTKTSRVWKVRWTSGDLGPGIHKVVLKHAGPSGTYVNLDAIQVSTP